MVRTVDKDAFLFSLLLGLTFGSVYLVFPSLDFQMKIWLGVNILFCFFAVFACNRWQAFAMDFPTELSIYIFVTLLISLGIAFSQFEIPTSIDSEQKFFLF